MALSAQQLKVISSVPGWVDTLAQSDKVSSEIASYEKVPLVFRAIHLRCNSLVSIPYVFKKGDKEVDALPLTMKAGPKMITPRKLLWLTEAAMLISGGAYWLDLRNSARRLGIQWINPLTMTPELLADNRLVFHQDAVQGNLSLRQTFSEDQIAYFSEFNLMNDTAPGQSAAGVALNDAQVLHYMIRFAGAFFEGGAMPITIVGIEGNLPQSDMDTLQERFKRAAIGIKNAFGAIGVRASTTVQTITPPLSDLAIPDLKKSAVDSVSDAFSIPLALFRDPNNRATADIQRQSFYTETVVPRALDLAETINAFLEDIGYSIEFRPNEMDIFQTDEASRSKSMVDLTNVLATATRDNVPTDKMMVMFDSLGYDFNDEQRAILEREPEKPDPPQPEATQDDNETSEMADLAKWRKKSLSSFKASENPVANFESDHISYSETQQIMNELSLCFSQPEIKAVFDERIS